MRAGTSGHQLGAAVPFQRSPVSNHEGFRAMRKELVRKSLSFSLSLSLSLSLFLCLSLCLSLSLSFSLSFRPPHTHHAPFSFPLMQAHHAGTPCRHSRLRTHLRLLRRPLRRDRCSSLCSDGKRYICAFRSVSLTSLYAADLLAVAALTWPSLSIFVLTFVCSVDFLPHNHRLRFP